MQTIENADESDHTSAETCTSFLKLAEDGVNFCGFENMYEKVLEMEDQLLYPEGQAQVGDEYRELKNSFGQF